MSEVAVKLREYLVNLPQQQGFKFSESTRRLIRRALYLSATHNGKYIHELFKDERYNREGTSITDASVQADLPWMIHDHKHTDPSHPNRPCAKKFLTGEPIYRCLTCGLDDTCALCTDCFDPEFHKGHQLYISICQRDNGGVCDCGDPEAWTVPLDCPYFHSSVIESDLPDDFYESLFETIEVVLDYVIDVMANSNLMYSAPQQTPVDIRRYSENSSLLASKYGAEDVNSEKYVLVLYNDQVRQQQDAIRRIHLATGKVKEFASMITREVELYGKALVLGSTDLELLIERQTVMTSTGFNTAIRSLRDVFREESCDEAIKWIEDITSSTIFQKYKDFRDLVCKAFVKKWESGVGPQVFPLREYQPGNLDRDHNIPAIRESVGRVHPEYWSETHSTWDLPEDICQAIHYKGDITSDGPLRGSRLQYLLFMDIRFWKSIRLVLHDLYIYVLIANLNYKQIITCQYVDIYPQMAEMFITTDREAESSAMGSLATQLFTCPSSATIIMKHGAMTKFLAVFYSYITKNVVQGPRSIDLSADTNFSNLKNRKWCQIFFDVRYIVSRNEQVDLIFDHKILNQVIDVLLLFQGLPTLKRSPIEHVEYESSDYTIYFHAISILSHFIEGIARCINKLSHTPENKERVLKAIQLVIHRLGEFMGLDSDSSSREVDTRGGVDVHLEPIKFKKFELTGDTIVDFEVSKQNVSFIHCLHSFLSWLVELNKFLGDSSDLKSIFLKYYEPETLFQGGDSTYSLAIFDFPLRTLVLLSQIKVGFWVRNGFSVRTQMQIYRKSTIRDGGYSRDLYLTQCFVASIPASVSASTILARWELIPWVEGDISSSPYGKDTTPLMVEECLLLFINLLTDDTHLQQLTGDKLNESHIIKQIICTLCFNPLSYSALMKELPEHIATEKRFEFILDRVADYIPPKSSNDVGLYALKEKFYDEIDPYFVHYSSNKRDDAIEVLKKRIHKKTGAAMDKIALKPKVIDFTSKNDVYKEIPKFTLTPLFGQFLRSALIYTLSKDGERSDTLLDLTLYLLAVCCDYNYSDLFIQSLMLPGEKAKDEPVASLLYQLLLQEEYKAYHVKVRLVFEYVAHAIDALSFNEKMTQFVADFDAEILKSTFIGNFCDAELEAEKKKRLAEKRKSKILARFKKQQAKFLANNDTMTGHHQDGTAGCGVTDCDTPPVDDCASSWSFPEEHCILCQMHKEEEPFGVVGCISSSPEFRCLPFDDSYWFAKGLSDNENLDQENVDFASDERYGAEWHNFMKAKRDEVVIGPAFPNRDGLLEDHHIFTSCSHGMHYSCFLQYYKDSRKRATQITRKLPEDFDKQEFLCPLCKSLNNCFIPIVSVVNKSSLNKYVAEPTQSIGWYHTLQAALKADFQQLKESYIMNAMDFAKAELSPTYYQALFVNPDKERKLHTNLVHSLASDLSMVNNLGDTFKKPDIEQIFLKTIESVEVSLRGASYKGSQNGLVFSQLSNQILTTLRIFHKFKETVELMNVFFSNKKEKKADGFNSSYISSIDQALGRISILSDPDDLADMMLNVDFFETLVECGDVCVAKTTPYSIIRLCYTAHVLQTMYLLTYKLMSHGVFLAPYIYIIPKTNNNCNIVSTRSLMVEMSRHIARNFDVSSNVFDGLLKDDEFVSRFFSIMTRLVNPFLRKIAILSFVKCADTSEIDFEKFDANKSEFTRLCDFLHLPQLIEELELFLQKGSSEQMIYEKFITKKPHLNLPLQSFHLPYPGIISLAELPERLDDFFTKLYYPHELSYIKNPAVCLHCCAILDMQNLSLDAQKGECYQHYKQHCFNDDNGVFLLPKNTKFLLIHEDNGSFHDAPYVDSHHELNKEGTIGQVMYLSKKKYSNFIRTIWLGHDIANFISRALENNVDVGGWETL